MIESMAEEIEIVNRKADELYLHYMDISEGDDTEACILACRGQIVLRRELGRMKAEAL